MTPDEMKAALEDQERLMDAEFNKAINALCQEYHRLLQPVPMLVPDGHGWKVSAEIKVLRTA